MTSSNLIVDVLREKCERSHLFFTRHFFKDRAGIKFRVNWHHELISEVIDDIITGKRQNVIINVSPGSSKTELVIINLIARGLAINPRARFLHLSASDSLALLNSATAREIITSDEYQRLWPLKIAEDANSKKRWNVLVDGHAAGGVYATSMGGQVTGFRAGQMSDGFTGALLIDDPLKPEDAFSRLKTDTANRKLITTVKSRLANPRVPIILVMQRIAENDQTGFILAGNLPGKWDHISIPAVLSIDQIPEKYREKADVSEIENNRFSYWPYKEPLQQLLSMERGDGTDQNGSRMSRHVFSAQYNQAPKALGGNLIRGEYFERYQVLPRIKHRKIFADTAQKTKEHNDFSVFEEWGIGIDGRLYLIDMIRGKWEAPELQRRAIGFWIKANSRDLEKFGTLRKLAVEDKSSGTGLVQTIRLLNNIPIEPIERVKDKLTRVMDALPYIEARQVCVPESAPFTNDFISECESFTADDSHDHDDQVDPLCDAVNDMLQSGNKLRQWEQLGVKNAT